MFEIRQKYFDLSSSFDESKGILIGKTVDEKLLAVRKNVEDKNAHLFVVAAEDSFVRDSFVPANVIQAIKNDENLFIASNSTVDYECFERGLTEAGYRVWIFDPTAPERSDPWNPLDLLSDGNRARRQLEIMQIARFFVAAADFENLDLESKAVELLTAIIAYVMLNEKIVKENKNLKTVFDLVTSKSIKELAELFREVEINDQESSVILKDHDYFDEAILKLDFELMLSLQYVLSKTLSHGLGELLSGSTIDLERFEHEKTALFYIQPQNESFEAAMGAFFVNRVLRTLVNRKRKEKLARDCFCVLDEFESLRIEKIFTRLDLGAKQGLNMALITRSLDRYKKDPSMLEYKKLLEACDSVITFGNGCKKGELMYTYKGFMPLKLKILQSEDFPPVFNTQPKAKIS